MSDSGRPGAALLAREEAPIWDLLAPRFPVVRRGYDRDAVDEYVAALESELEELRAAQVPSSAVAAEIERIGEQTAAILQVAHEQASETTRRARIDADRCMQAAAANAVAITEDAQNKLRQLDAETDVIWRERRRLLDDVRGVATSLFGLAEEALERFPVEQEPAAGPQEEPGVDPGPALADEPAVDSEHEIDPEQTTEFVQAGPVAAGPATVEYQFDEAEPSVEDEQT